MRLYAAKNKKVLRIRNGAADFLKSFSTASADMPRGAFLNPRGEIVAAFEQICVRRDEALIAVERPFTERLLGHLEKYLKLGETTVEEKDSRVYFDLEPSPARVFVAQEDLPSTVTEEEFTLFRLKNHLPLQGADYDGELVLNVGEELVSFTKGCYLGQEIVARVHYRGVPPKRLMAKSLLECTPEEASAMTSKAVDPETGRTFGFVFIKKEER